MAKCTTFRNALFRAIYLTLLFQIQGTLSADQGLLRKLATWPGAAQHRVTRASFARLPGSAQRAGIRNREKKNLGFSFISLMQILKALHLSYCDAGGRPTPQRLVLRRVGGAQSRAPGSSPCSGPASCNASPADRVPPKHYPNRTRVKPRGHTKRSAPIAPLSVTAARSSRAPAAASRFQHRLHRRVDTGQASAQHGRPAGWPTRSRLCSQQDVGK